MLCISYIITTKNTTKTSAIKNYHTKTTNTTVAALTVSKVSLQMCAPGLEGNPGEIDSNPVGLVQTHFNLWLSIDHLNSKNSGYKQNQQKHTKTS